MRTRMLLDSMKYGVIASVVALSVEARADARRTRADADRDGPVRHAHRRRPAPCSSS